MHDTGQFFSDETGTNDFAQAMASVTRKVQAHKMTRSGKGEHVQGCWEIQCAD